MISLGERIKALRAERTLQQRQLAEKAGLTPSMLSQIESGRLTPSLHTLGKVAGALGVSIASAFAHGPLHGAVDLAGVEAVLDHGPGQVGERSRLGGEVALVGDGDDAVAEAEGEQHLRRGWDQAGYAHAGAQYPIPPSGGYESYIHPCRMAEDDLPRSTGSNSR